MLLLELSNKMSFFKINMIYYLAGKGSVDVKCKKNYILKCTKKFCLKLPNSSKKPIKKFLHFKMLKSKNVRFQKSEYNNTMVRIKQCNEKCNKHLQFLLTFSSMIPIYILNHEINNCNL